MSGFKKVFKGVIAKAKERGRQKSLSATQQQDQPAISAQVQGQAAIKVARPYLQRVTQNDVISYRYHQGVNFGSIFVLEKWLTGSMFPNGGSGDSELDAVQASLSSIGLDSTRAKFQQHWANTISDDDWRWLAGDGCVTSIRLPIGYFTLGKEFCRGTPFEGVSEAYRDAWNAVKQLVAKASSYGIGCILDFHALPGGANPDSHSGTSYHRTELWGNQQNLDLATKCLTFIAQDCLNSAELKSGVIGLQLVNEATRGAYRMYDWYASVLRSLFSVNPELPVFISDAWDLIPALAFADSINSSQNRNQSTTIVDVHRYYCFSDEDKNSNPQQLINKVNLNEVDQINEKGSGAIVGEYSCVIDEQSWRKAPSSERANYIRTFGQKQSSIWNQSSGGSFFWTYKMDWFPGGEWGYYNCRNNLIMPRHAQTAPLQIQSLANQARSSQDRLKNAALAAHSSYWNKQSPGKPMEHFRFADGYGIGYMDALEFFVFRSSNQNKGARKGGDKIGLKDVFIARRYEEYVASRQQQFPGENKEYYWEWTHGMRQGIADFEQQVGFDG